MSSKYHWPYLHDEIMFQYRHSVVRYRQNYTKSIKPWQRCSPQPKFRQEVTPPQMKSFHEWLFWHRNHSQKRSTRRELDWSPNRQARTSLLAGALMRSLVFALRGRALLRLINCSILVQSLKPGSMSSLPNSGSSTRAAPSRGFMREVTCHRCLVNPRRSLLLSIGHHDLVMIV